MGNKIDDDIFYLNNNNNISMVNKNDNSHIEGNKINNNQSKFLILYDFNNVNKKQDNDISKLADKKIEDEGINKIQILSYLVMLPELNIINL